jgi:hypothetical protein
MLGPGDSYEPKERYDCTKIQIIFQFLLLFTKFLVRFYFLPVVPEFVEFVVIFQTECLFCHVNIRSSRLLRLLLLLAPPPSPAAPSCSCSISCSISISCSSCSSSSSPPLTPLLPHYCSSSVSAAIATVNAATASASSHPHTLLLFQFCYAMQRSSYFIFYKLLHLQVACPLPTRVHPPSPAPVCCKLL